MGISEDGGVEPEVEAPPPGGAEHFGSEAWAKLEAFAAMLAAQGEVRGLLGPREYGRLWSRHILNSTALLDFLEEGVRVADIGSGAGFPGIVLAALRPDLRVALIDSMERRCLWLEEVVAALELDNAHVRYCDVRDLKGNFQTDVATARAVASVAKLVPIAMPIVRGGGTLLALKGERVGEEIDAAHRELRHHRAAYADIHTVTPFGCQEATRVLEVRKK